MSTPDAPAPAGWYDDEADASRLRYWDGAKWSPHTAPKPADAAGPTPFAAVAGGADGADAPGAMNAPVAAEPVADDAIDESTTVRPARHEPSASSGPLPAEDTVTIVRTPGAPTPLPGPVPTLPPVPPAAPAPPVSGALLVPPAPPAPPASAGDGRVEEHTTLPLPPGAASAGFSYAPYRTEGRTFVATWLFAMLLGFWGADRFYLGKIGTAIAKLLTLGGLGVWVLVDLLLVLFGAQRDREGRPLAGYEEHKRIAWIVTGGLVVLAILSSVVSNLVAFSLR